MFTIHTYILAQHKIYTFTTDHSVSFKKHKLKMYILKEHKCGLKRYYKSVQIFISQINTPNIQMQSFAAFSTLKLNGYSTNLKLEFSYIVCSSGFCLSQSKFV